MGSLTLLDIISSSIIGGLLLLSALRMNESARSNTFQAQSSLTVQQNMTSVVENLEWDFRLVGYSRDSTIDASSFVLAGDSDMIKFQEDVDDDGRMDTVSWSLGRSPIPGCPNPRVRMLQRSVRMGDGHDYTSNSNMGLTEFKFTFFDALNDTIATPFNTEKGVQIIEVALKVEPIYSYADTSNRMVFSAWRQTRLVSKNLNNR